MTSDLLPGTGIALSPLCLGGASLGTTLDQAASYALLDAFVDLGGTMVDTAATYADWHGGEASASEKLLGRWLRSRRHGDRITVATKGACPRPGRFFRLQPDDIRDDLEASLRHLGRERIELYWLHRDDPTVPVEVIIDALAGHAAAGRIGRFGCSNWSLARIREANAYALWCGVPGFVANQPMWSLSATRRDALDDQTLVLMDAELHRYHQERGWPALPFSSQASGFFSGRYHRDDTPPDRASFVRQYWTEDNFARLARVEQLAGDLGRPPAAVALAYLLNQPFPVSPIIGASSVAQLTESWQATSIRLAPEVVAWLEHG